MRHSININQLNAHRLGSDVDANDLVLLDTIVRISKLPTAIVREIGEVKYLQLSPVLIVDQLPVFSKSTDTAYRQLASLERRGWITKHPSNKKNRTSLYHIEQKTIELMSDNQEWCNEKEEYLSDNCPVDTTDCPIWVCNTAMRLSDIYSIDTTEGPIRDWNDGDSFFGQSSDEYRNSISLEKEKENTLSPNAHTYTREGVPTREAASEGEGVSTSFVSKEGDIISSSTQPPVDDESEEATELDLLIDKHKKKYPGTYPDAFYNDAICFFEQPSYKDPRKTYWKYNCGIDPIRWLNLQLQNRWEKDKRRYDKDPYADMDPDEANRERIRTYWKF